MWQISAGCKGGGGGGCGSSVLGVRVVGVAGQCWV